MTFFCKGGRHPPLIPPLGPLPPGPLLEASPPHPQFHPAVLLVQKSAYTTFKHHNSINTAAMQILLTSLKNLKPQQLNLFTPLWMKISVYGSAGHFVHTLCLCSVLTCIICNSLNTGTPQNLLALLESLRSKQLGISFSFGQYRISKAGLANNLCKSNTSVQYSQT